ncbi:MULTISPECIES: MMPL family transporter [Dyella]|nr:MULTISPECIES: MMPL family transporter [Dyella]
MNVVSPRVRAAVFAVAVMMVACLGGRLLFGRGESPIQTDLLAMLPPTERHPMAEMAVDRLAHANGDRMVLLLESTDDEHARAAARLLGKQLGADPAFSSVVAELPDFDLEAMLAPYLAHRFQLLNDQDRASLVRAGFDPAQALAKRLNEPFLAGVGIRLQDDPFGWMQHWLDGAPWTRSPLMPEDDLLTAHRGDLTYVLVMANLHGSSYDDGIQRASLAALERASIAMRQQFPDVTMSRTGAVFYAAAARAGAERDVHLVSVVSTAGIALLLLWAFRSVRPLWVAFLSTAMGVVCALTVTLLVFGQIHLLTLVFGAALLGEAVDYSIQYLCARSHAGATWRPLDGLRQVRPALWLALATSVLGYSLLAAMPFPALRQMACFAVVGMLAACLSVFWLLPALLQGPARRPMSVSLVTLAHHLQRRVVALTSGKRRGVLALILLVVAAPGWWRLGHDDDIHLLVSPPPELQAQESHIRDITGLGNGSQFYLVHGLDEEQVLQREEALAVRLQAMVNQGALESWTGLASMVPSLERQRADHALLKPFFVDTGNLRTTLTGAGLKPGVVDAYLAAWPGTSLRLRDWLTWPIAVPFRDLWLDGGAEGVASIVLPQGATDVALLGAAADGLEGVELVDKPASVSDLFGRYRRLASGWLLAATALVGLVFAWRYRRGAWRVLAPSVLGMGLSLSALGYLGQPLTLFHWMALMLVLGVGANYAVFLREGEPHVRHRPGASFAGVLLSALTAWLSFGLLSLSTLPALQHFGITLLLGIGFTVICVPIATPVTEHDTNA